MITIILAASDECKDAMKKNGFVEQTVLVRHEAGMSGLETKTRVEREIMEGRPRPWQFTVTDFWGASHA